MRRNLPLVTSETVPIPLPSHWGHPDKGFFWPTLTCNYTHVKLHIPSFFLCTPPSTPIDTFSLDKKKEKWRDLLRAPSFERSAQDRDGTSLSDPLCSVLHNRRLRRVCAAVAFRRRNAFKGTSRLTPSLGFCTSAVRQFDLQKRNLCYRRRAAILPFLSFFHPQEKNEVRRRLPFLLLQESVVAGSRTSSRCACKFGRKKKWKRTHWRQTPDV